MTVSWTNATLAAGSAALGALIVIALLAVFFAVLGRRWEHASRLADSARYPFRTLVVVLALTGWVLGVRGDDLWWDAASLTCRILAIGAGAWLLAAVLVFLEDLALARTNVDEPDNRIARRRRTQVLIIKRLTIVAVVVVAIGAVLLSFPGVRAIGASLLASAGVISVVAALAAQSTLANLFAGVQLAFNNAIKIDDAVIVEEEWGWIEEITLSYVVVRLWDERRMVLPSTYFTTTPFQNWTRNTSELMGAVELDVDWRVDTVRLREQLTPVMAEAGTEGLWDGRVAHFQVTDAVGGFVRIRILVTAVDAPTLYDLRCLVRERLVQWLRESDPDALPRQRLLLDPPTT
ncbi:mechanosensitive ion channel [soil metagenome]